MTPAKAWKTLGIERTADRRSIKRAYAAKLKAIDPDNDAAAFLALREALEVAFWQAEIAENETAEPSGNDELAGPEGKQETIAPSDQEADPPSNDPRYRLAEILWGDDPIGSREVEAVNLAQTILDRPEMEQVGESAATEDWFAWLLANTMRRSDCVIPAIVNHFDWKTKTGSVHSNPAAEAVVGRYHDLVILEALKRPHHVDHATFRRLATPRTGPLGLIERTIFRSDVGDFLAKIRSTSPTVEWDFDPQTVAMWEQHIGAVIAHAPAEKSKGGLGCTWYTWLIAAWFLLTVVRTVMSAG